MTIALPSAFRPSMFMLQLQANQRTFASPFAGSEQTLDMLQDRWMVSLALPPRLFTDAGAIEAFINAMRGQTEVCYLYHFGRQAPQGTMRGAPTVITGTAQAASLTVQTTAGATLLAGDLIGAAGLLLQASQDCTANGSGVLVVPLVNRLRKAITVGTSVSWDRPAAPFRMVSPVGVQFVPGYAEGVSLDFLEAVDL